MKEEKIFEMGIILFFSFCLPLFYFMPLQVGGSLLGLNGCQNVCYIHYLYCIPVLFTCRALGQDLYIFENKYFRKLDASNWWATSIFEASSWHHNSMNHMLDGNHIATLCIPPLGWFKLRLLVFEVSCYHLVWSLATSIEAHILWWFLKFLTMALHNPPLLKLFCGFLSPPFAIPFGSIQTFTLWQIFKVSNCNLGVVPLLAQFKLELWCFNQIFYHNLSLDPFIVVFWWYQAQQYFEVYG
jgi:hypothetical protein